MIIIIINKTKNITAEKTKESGKGKGYIDNSHVTEEKLVKKKIISQAKIWRNQERNKVQ